VRCLFKHVDSGYVDYLHGPPRFRDIDYHPVRSSPLGLRTSCGCPRFANPLPGCKQFRPCSLQVLAGRV